jgi:uncharacterized protein (DUF1697 family)
LSVDVNITALAESVVAAMQTYVAFIRAINVGGRAIVKMTDLQEAFASVGCTKIVTFARSTQV